MTKFVFDELNKVPLKLKNYKAIDEVNGTEEEYDETKYYNQYVEITESSYDLLSSNLVLYLATNNNECLQTINKELRKYGL
ncbi:hypothetical protein [Gottfriedia acidiceleris]|uniref:hypothetical protein n=1 Tax=Gottfriedia acidiceleris TaxID=371036 RepID=UPI002FFF4404